MHRLHWSCVARTVFEAQEKAEALQSLFSWSVDVHALAQIIRVEESALDILGGTALPFHGHAHLIAWTPTYGYGATARARRGKFTLNFSSGAGAGEEQGLRTSSRTSSRRDVAVRR